MSMSGEGIPNYNQYMVDVAVPSEVAVPQGKLLNSSLQSFSEVEGGFNDIYITSYYEDNQVALDISSNEGADEEDLMQAIDGFLSDEQMFSESSVAHNGDQMRGPYLKVDLEVTTPRQIELHAINVDYEFSKLDKRLTQNT